MKAPGRIGNALLDMPAELYLIVLDGCFPRTVRWHTGCNVEINGRRLYVRVDGRDFRSDNNAAGCNS